MIADRHPSPRKFYKNTVFFLLAIFFSFSLITIALDQHFDGYSPTCLICQAKSSINGTESAFILEFNTTITNFVRNEHPTNFPIPILSLFLNKSPPKYFLVY
jgi:hypothetical protein